jgi:WhiB family redox-sensing transcriptional regulator
MTADDLDWMDAGLCAQSDPEAWFPEMGAPNKFAKRICGRCPVRDECAAYAIADPSLVGVWGGLSERERQAVRASRQTAVAA